MAIETPDSGITLAPLDVSKLKVTLTSTPKDIPPAESLKFGKTYSDHMVFITYDPATGWSDPEIKPYAPLSLDPASSCVQFCSNVFEGMKAYVGADGTPRLFRPSLNMRRLERSAARLALPPFDGDVLLELIKRLVQVERRWIPTLSGCSLYLRPTIVGTMPGFSVVPSESATLVVIASPSGPYFSGGVKPVSLLAVSDTVRAWPGGTGGHKVGGNYSPGFLPQKIAEKQGYNMVLWIFGEDKSVTEAGAMNFFVVLKRDEGGLDLITPPLDGTILPGVTRSSCLALAADPSFQKNIASSLHAHERKFTMNDILLWSKEGRLLEALCVGTAAILVSVDRIGYEGSDIFLPKCEGGLGPVGRAFREKILAIQEGKEEFGEWSVPCE
ncbi:branched-chain amino acid aminotransferase II [Leucogyrophana mollusca]|uniref:Branched-chain amino acid aminotransferase II n=1 Tax=Leucogyrophana mollusca TaxID=85980 RepID=A0ACB8BP86_9AGAM|nr:branched-chain amino acid aminotransferase II [Leucogyrophana mollusca]